jgi:hypothetical protein
VTQSRLWALTAREATCHNGNVTRTTITFPAAVGITALLLSGCANDTKPTWSAASLSVVDSDTIDSKISPTTPSAVSPDGSQIFVERGGELCVVTIAESDSECRELTTALGTARWSPDSKRIVYTEDFLRQQREPDVWVLEVDGMDVENLTDDDVSVVRLDDEEERNQSNYDLFPTWTSNSELVFVRYEQGDFEQAPLLMRANIGGDVEEIGDVEIDRDQRLFSPLVIDPERRQLHTFAESRDGDPELVRIDVKTADVTAVAKLRDVRFPAIIQVSSTGDHALVVEPDALAQPRPGSEPIVLVDLTTGDKEPLLEASDDGELFATPNAAAFSPDGRAIAVAIRGGDDEANRSLWAVDVADVDGSLTLDDFEPVVEASDIDGLDADAAKGFYGFGYSNPTFGWTAEGTLVVPYGLESVVALRLKAG